MPRERHARTNLSALLKLHRMMGFLTVRQFAPQEQP
jgi:hypothetical protein